MKQALVKYTHLANKVMYATFARYFEYKKNKTKKQQTKAQVRVQTNGRP